MSLARARISEADFITIREKRFIYRKYIISLGRKAEGTDLVLAILQIKKKSGSVLNKERTK